MKKLLFIILTLLFTTQLFSDILCRENVIRFSSHTERKWYDRDILCSNYGNKPVMQTNGYWYCYYPAINEFWVPDDQTCPSQKNSSYLDTRGISTLTTDGEIVYTPNPDPAGGSRCDKIFNKDGFTYYCNPNTNEATAVPDLDYNPETGDVTCKTPGNVLGLTTVLPDNIGEYIYNQYSCTSPGGSAGAGDNGDGGEDTGTGGGDTGTGGGSTGGGSTGGGDTGTGGGSTGGGSTGGGDTGTGGGDTGTGGGSTGGGSTGGGDTGTGGGDTGTGGGDTGTGGGSTGGGSTGGGDTGTGGGDTGTGGGDTGGEETPPIDDTPSTCDDSGLNLQEKMLCEMNKGIKKLNSESAPSNSLNQLMKDLNNKSTQNNDSLDVLKNNTNVTNSKLDNTNTKLETLNTTNKATNTKLDTLSTNTSSTNTKLDSLNTATNTGNSTLKDIEKATNSVKNATTSNTSVLMDIDDTLKSIDDKLGDKDSDKVDEYNSDLEKLKGDSESSNNDFMNFYNSMKDSYTALNNQIEGYQSIFENGFKFKPINNSVDNSSIKQCLTITVFGKPVVLDWITPINYIKPITTILLQFFIFLEVGKMFYRVINYTRSVF